MDIRLEWGLCCENYRCRFRSHLSPVGGLRSHTGGMDEIASLCLQAPSGEGLNIQCYMMCRKVLRSSDGSVLLMAFGGLALRYGTVCPWIVAGVQAHGHRQ
jgi:hypothetical protein